MTRTYLIITLLALLGVVAGGLHLKKVWQDFTVTHNVASIQPEPEPPGKARSFSRDLCSGTSGLVCNCRSGPLQFRSDGRSDHSSRGAIQETENPEAVSVWNHVDRKRSNRLAGSKRRSRSSISIAKGRRGNGWLEARSNRREVGHRGVRFDSRNTYHQRSDSVAAS